MTNPVAVAFIAGQETYSEHAYWDENGYACGYGLHAPDINANTTMTEPEAMARLSQRVDDIQNQLAPLITIALNQNQWAAILSFSYNVGVNAFAASHLRIFINQGSFALASSQFGLWVHAGGVVNAGLVARRAAEAALFDSAPSAA